MGTLGRSDTPFLQQTSLAEDRLGLEAYARALAEFIQSCEMPMTIGIQGEWGSGKTSLMNMVRGILDPKKQSEPAPAALFIHNFETWQYGAVGDDQMLGLQLVTTLADQIVAANSKSGEVVSRGGMLRHLAAQLGRKLSEPGIVRAVASSAAGAIPFVDGGELASAIGTFLSNDGRGQSRSHDAHGLSQLRLTFAELVKSVAKADPNKRGARDGRFVIFIDDLDRIRPGCAVSLLEVLKNFLDVDYCVFVIACDYEVVRLGIKERFGIKDKAKVRAFFDKIIQVPFQMPVNLYHIDGLLREYVEQKLVDDKKDAQRKGELLANQIAPLVRRATGTNPRAFKRFLNVLDLNSCVRSAANLAGAAGPEVTPAPRPWVDRGTTVGLVGLVALQARWPRVADYLTSRPTTDVMRASLLRLTGAPAAADGPASDLDDVLLEEYGGPSIENPWQQSEVEELSEFTTQLCTLLNESHADEPLSEAALKPLMDWAKHLSLTRVGKSETSRVVGWDAFTASVTAAAPECSSAYLRLAAGVFARNNQWKGALLSIRQAQQFYTIAILGSGKQPTIISLNPDLQVTLAASNVRAQELGLTDISAVAASFVNDSEQRFHLTARPYGKTGWRFDFRKLSPKDVDEWTKRFLRMLDEIAALIRAASTQSPPVVAAVTVGD